MLRFSGRLLQKAVCGKRSFLLFFPQVPRITSTYPAFRIASLRKYSTNNDYLNHEEPLDIFLNRFITAFNNPKIDGWDLRSWLQKLHLEDCVPPPEIVCCALRACRRLNDLALAIRFLEALRVCSIRSNFQSQMKCTVIDGSYEWLIGEIEPTLKELGIPKLSELGYDKPELAWKDDELYW